MDTYTNPQMLNPEELHKAHLEMAINYLESKWDGSFYEVDPRSEETCNEDDIIANENGDFEDFNVVESNDPSCSPEDTINNSDEFYQQGTYYVKLTNQQFTDIQKRIKESEGKDLDEVLDDAPELRNLLFYQYEDADAEYYGCDCAYASRIGETPHQICNITVCTIDQTGKTQVFPYDILLTKDDYLKLLVIVMDHRRVTFNSLYEYDLDLYKKISEINNLEAISISESDNKVSYTLVFTEIEKDVFELLGEGDTVVGLCDETNDNGEDSITNIWACFSENRMAVWHDYTYPFQNDVEVIYNIDAKAVLKALNVNSYHDAAIVMKARFSGTMAYHHIIALLDRNKIEYQHAEETTELDDPLSC